MKNKKAAFLLALAVAALASPGGAVAEEAQEQNAQTQEESTQERERITLTDNAGREVELECPVETAVSALRYNNELIRACGAIDHIISVDLNTAQDREYWGMFDPDEVIGKSQRELDYEKIVELDPEVVILPANGAYEEAEEKLEPFGIPVFVISGYDTADFKDQVSNIGTMFGTQEEAQEFYDYFNGKLEYIREQLEGVEKRTLYIESTSDLTTIFPGDPMFDMVDYAFADNIFAVDYENVNKGEVDPEEVIARDPEVIIKLVTPAEAMSGTGLYMPPSKEEFQAAYDTITGRAGWDEIEAVKNDDIYFMTQFSHGGASKLVGTCYIAKMLYPDLLPQLDPAEVFRAWMEDFQGFENVEGHFYSGKDLHS